MSIFELLFGFQGRINRAHWWLGQSALAALIAIFIYLHGGGTYPAGLMKAAPPAQSFKFFGTMLIATAMLSSALVWVAFSLAIKRLHDRNQSGWKALVFGVPVVAAFVMPNTATHGLAAAAVAWYILELGCLRGDPLHNKHGAATTPDNGTGDDAVEDVDPLQLSLSANIARQAVKATSNRTARPSAPAANTATSSGFGRRPR